MSGFIQVEGLYLEPITVELPNGFPESFTIDCTLTQPFVIEANFGIIGPQGEKGDMGDLSQSSIGDLLDVTLTSPQNGDTLIFQSGTFTNINQSTITDGGNF